MTFKDYIKEEKQDFPTKIKGKIYVTQFDNDDYFNQKLPTWRNNFTIITRSIVDIHTDEFGGIVGVIKVKGRKLVVAGGVNFHTDRNHEWTIDGWE